MSVASSVLAMLVLVVACGDATSSPGDGGFCPAGTMLVGDDCVQIGPTSTGAVDSGSSESTGAPMESSSSGGPADSTGDESSGAAESSSTGGGVVAIDLHDAIIFDNPPNVADWPVTTTITRLEFRDDGLYVEFDKKDGEGRWPDIVPPEWDGPLQYTLGLVENIGGQWYASAAMQYWYGLEAQGGNVAVDDQVAINWYYDGRWGEMAGYQPMTGETIGVFIVAGNVRGVTDGSQSPVQERSNVVVVPMPDASGAVHDF